MDRTASHCRHCRFYTPEGRRGGHCGQLGVNVSGSWQSCDLSLSPFAPSWESAEAFPVNHHRGRVMGDTPQFSDRPDPKVASSHSEGTLPPSSNWTENLALMDAHVPQFVKVER